MDFNPNKTPIQIIKKVRLGVLNLDKLIDRKKWWKIIDAGSKFDDFLISPKIRQILLHWGYELTEKEFFNELTN